MVSEQGTRTERSRASGILARVCGIAGWISAGTSPEAPRLVREIVESQRSRGPDHSCVVEARAQEPQIVLGHNRLIVIDPAPEANQPFWHSTQNACLIFNGEVYNYVELREELRALGSEFRTRSDTEVILDALLVWGEDALAKFNGMFAFALCRPDAGEILLARDRFGVKPLFVRHSTDEVAFASSARVLAGWFGCPPDLRYVSRGIATWNFDRSDRITPYDGIEQLEPGELLVASFESGRLACRRRRWYDLASRVATRREEVEGLSESDAVDAVRTTLDSSVTLRLRADVPVAVALSAGLDSSVITAMLAREHPEVRAITFGDPDDSATEGPLAQEVARQAGVDVEWVRCGAKDIGCSYLETLEAQDAPFVSGAQVAHFAICRAAAASGYHVLLGGQGGDEAFMGYRKYFMFALAAARRERRFADAARLLAGLATILAGEAAQWPNYWRHRRRFMGHGDPRVLRLPEHEQPRPMGLASGESPEQRQAVDVTDLSLPTLLRYEDRNSMAHSVESRLPFLDYRVIELGLALPERFKLRGGYGKWVVREAARGLIPEKVRRARYKIGFSTAQPQWVTSGLGGVLREEIAEHLPKLRDLTRGDVVPERDFSDDRLTRDVTAMPEALTLVWLGRRL